MLDVIARLLLSAGIMVGTAYLPSLSEAVGARQTGAHASATAVKVCPAKPASVVGARALACQG